MQMWAAAYQSKNDQVMSAAAVALALLLKVLSSMIDMVPYGLGICRTLLQRRGLELIAWNLSAEKSKAFVISPTLRLVREMVCFFSGELADDIFRSRLYALKSLGRNVSIRYLGDGVEQVDRPSIRTTAIRLFLSLVKFVNFEARQELLSQKDIITNMFRNLKEDPPHLVHEVLSALKASVLGDKTVPSFIKLKVFNAYTLPCLTALYSYSHDTEEDDDDERRVTAVAHRLLLQLCSSEDGGILRPHAGFYPPGIDPDNEAAAFWRQAFTGEIPVKHNTLLGLAKSLKPWSSVKQSELLLAMFRAAPELVAPYFRQHANTPPSTKPTATFIGHVALLFSVVKLPIPPFFGHFKLKCAKLPPPTSIVLDNILPPPLTREATSKCLAQQQSNLVSFSITRLLVVAFQKLERTCLLYERTNNEEWLGEAARLKAKFASRVPSANNAFKAYLAIPQKNVLHREAASRLLHLYPRIITHSIQTTNHDISPPLLGVIKRLETKGEYADDDDEGLSRMELENLVSLASISLGVRWFSRAGGLSMCLFTSLLRLSLDSPLHVLPERFLAALHLAAQENNLVGAASKLSAFVCLFRTLQNLGQKVTAETWGFVDNCVARCANAELKYLLLAMELGEKENGRLVENHISPLTMAFSEQLPFAVKSLSEKELVPVARFLSGYLKSCESVESTFQLGLVRISMIKAMEPCGNAREAVKAIKEAPTEFPELVALPDSGTVQDCGSRAIFEKEGWLLDSEGVYVGDLDSLLGLEPQVEPENSALTKWVGRPVDSLVRDGHISSLIMLLTSNHPAIRLEAASNLTKLATKVKGITSYIPHMQIWLLLMELVETVSPNLAQESASGVVTAFTCHSLRILTNPLHQLYPALNKFLCDDPTWKTNKLPFVRSFLAGDPEAEGAFFIGLLWILGYLADGMRSKQDVSLLTQNRRDVERLLTISCVHPKTKERVRFAALGMLSRVAEVETGPGALLTRFGMVSWLETMEARAKNEDKEREQAAFRLLREKILANVNDDTRERWSKAGGRKDEGDKEPK